MEEITVIIECDADGYFAYSPTLEGCYSQGDTLKETIENMLQAVALYIEVLNHHT